MSPQELAAELREQSVIATVTVSAYVEVDEGGDWYAGGSSGWSDEDAIACVSECVAPGRGSWVTARVPKPEPTAEVEGQVSS